MNEKKANSPCSSAECEVELESKIGLRGKVIKQKCGKVQVNINFKSTEEMQLHTCFVDFCARVVNFQ